MASKPKPKPALASISYRTGIISGYCLNPYIKTGFIENRSERGHVSGFNSRDITTHGYFCPHCGYKLFWDKSAGYYCDCIAWKEDADLRNSFDNLS